MSARLPVCLSVCLSVCQSVCLSCLPCLSVCLSVCQSVLSALSLSLSVCLPVCLSVCLSVCQSHTFELLSMIHFAMQGLSVCLSVCLSCLPVCLSCLPASLSACLSVVFLWLQLASAISHGCVCTFFLLSELGVRLRLTVGLSFVAYSSSTHFLVSTFALDGLVSDFDIIQVH